MRPQTTIVAVAASLLLLLGLAEAFSACPAQCRAAPSARGARLAGPRFMAGGDADAGDAEDPNEIIGRRITVQGDVNGGYVRTCINNEAGNFRRLLGTMSVPDETDEAEIYVEVRALSHSIRKSCASSIGAHVRGGGGSWGTFPRAATHAPNRWPFRLSHSLLPPPSLPFPPPPRLLSPTHWTVTSGQAQADRWLHPVVQKGRQVGRAQPEDDCRKCEGRGANGTVRWVLRQDRPKGMRFP